jgi:peptide/nickel transport system substrate-binding protein
MQAHDWQRNRSRAVRRLMQRRAFLGLAAGTSLAAFLAACGGSGDSDSGGSQSSGVTETTNTTDTGGQVQAVQGGELVYGLATEPATGGIDPHQTPAAVAHTVLQNVHDTLVVMTPDFQFKPGLAESWAIEQDGRVYTFKLKQDVTFHDGTPFNAEAVKFNLDRIIDPATQSRLAVTMVGSYERTEVVDETTAKVYFREPYGVFLDALSNAFLGIVSPAAAQKYGLDLARNPVGTGPFTFKEWVAQDHLTLERNPNYQWGSSVLHSGPAYLDRVTFKFIPEAATRIATLQSGETQLIETIPPQDVQRVKDAADLKILTQLRPGSPYVERMNVSRPPFDDPRVRQAVLAGLDRAGIVRTVERGQYPGAEGALSPTTFAYDASVEGMYTLDQQKAKQLLDAAGWTAGAGGIRQKNGEPLKIVYLGSNVNRENRHELAQFMQGQLKEIGIDMELQLLPTAQFTENSNSNRYNMSGTSFVFSDPDILRVLYYSKNVPPLANSARLNDPAVDSALLEGAATVDPEKRKATYATIQQKLMSDAIIVPLYSFPNILGARGELHDVKYDPRAYSVLVDAFVKRG